MKKSIVLLFCFALLFTFILNFVKAEETLPFSPISDKDMQRLENLPEEAQTKWEYLQKEWKTILTKNKIVNATNNFMSKKVPDTTFRILFGINWDVEYIPTILGVVILWLFFFVAATNFLKAGFSSVTIQEIPGFVIYIASLLFMIVLAQLNIFYNLIVWLGRLIFKQENFWIRFIYFLIIVFILVILAKFSNTTSKVAEESKKKRKEEAKDEKIEKANKFVKGVNEGFSYTKGMRRGGIK